MKLHSRTSAMLLAAMLATAFSSNVLAQHDHSQHTPRPAAKPTKIEPLPADHAGMDHSGSDDRKQASEPVLGAELSTHASMGHDSMQHAPRDHAAMGHEAAASALPIDPILPLTDADRAAAFPLIDHRAMQHASALHHYVLFNRLEAWDGGHGNGQAWEGSAWMGNDTDRLWLRSEGERTYGRTEAADVEALYGRSVSPWWDVLVGVKHDFLPTDPRTWVAFGIQGMAPYKFEFAATAYLGESGHAAATVEVEYELLLTPRLILQPLLELRFYTQDDPLRRTGSGLSKAETGLRLRYEINRQVAPYVGVVHERVFGGTADYHAAEGEDASDTRVVAGIRFWF